METNGNGKSTLSIFSDQLKASLARIVGAFPYFYCAYRQLFSAKFPFRIHLTLTKLGLTRDFLSGTWGRKFSIYFL